jgi:hypothetical protein
LASVLRLNAQSGGRITPEVNTVTEDTTWQNPYHLNAPNPCNISPPLVCESTPGPLAAQYDRHDRRTPYVGQWTASVQRQLTELTVLELDYFALPATSFSAATTSICPYRAPCRQPLRSRTPWQEIGSIQYVDGDRPATYESLVIKRTFPKSTRRAAIRACIKPCEHGPSQFNQKYRWVTSALYDLGRSRAFMTGGGVADVRAGGWRMSSIVTWRRGFPFGIGTGVNRDGVGRYRPNAVSGPSRSLSNPSTAE